MIVKKPILKNRVRKVPNSFSWIDHRLVRDRHIEKCSQSELALYLFLVCVSDSKGLSYYGDKSICSRLSISRQMLEQARSALINNGLIAWKKPVYQVLCLEPIQNKTRRQGTMMSFGDILKTAAEGSSD